MTQRDLWCEYFYEVVFKQECIFFFYYISTVVEHSNRSTHIIDLSNLEVFIKLSPYICRRNRIHIIATYSNILLEIFLNVNIFLLARKFKL